jgi:starch synthase (maltosyl-transferring)
MLKTKNPFPIDGKTRPVIENISPEINNGKYSPKATEGQRIQISADILIDGHDILGSRLLYKHEKEKTFTEAKLFDLGNDRFIGEIYAEKVGFYTFKIEAWVDHFATWQHEVDEKIKANLKLEVELLVGIELLTIITKTANEDDKKEIKNAIEVFKNIKKYEEAIVICRSQQMHNWIDKYI